MYSCPKAVIANPQAWNLQAMEICPLVTLEAKDQGEKELQIPESVTKAIVFPIPASAGW